MNIIREKKLVIFIEEISSEKLHFLCSDEQSPFNSRTSPDIDIQNIERLHPHFQWNFKRTQSQAGDTNESFYP